MYGSPQRSFSQELRFTLTVCDMRFYKIRYIKLLILTHISLFLVVNYILNKMKKSKQQTLLTALSRSNSCRKCIAVASHHQGELENGGQQCTCVVLVFLTSSAVAGMSTDVDRFLQLGTDLFNSINQGQPLLITELPNEIILENGKVKVDYRDPRCGILSQSSDNTAAMSFEVGSALNKSLIESNTCFMTIGNNPAVTIGFSKHEDKIIILHSHSRDRRGLCCPDGKAVILQVNNITTLVEYVKEMSRSVSSSEDLPFEVTPVIFSKQPESDAIQVNNPSTEQQSSEDIHMNKRAKMAPILPEFPENMNESDEPSQSASSVGPSTMRESAPDDDLVIPEVNEEQSSTGLPDISRYARRSTTDNIKNNLIENRVPRESFTFPRNKYKDKRSKDGYMSRSCCRDWFFKFKFLTYSEATDGLFCIACVLFPDKSHRRPKKLITEPYQNWKDALNDLKNHAVCDYH